MKVLFVGGTGNISSACVARALEKGYQVTIVNRGRSGQYQVPPPVAVFTGDIRDTAAMRKLLDGMRFDAVVQFQAFAAEHVEADLDLFAGNTGQYVLISTASAYQKPPVDYLIRESTPLHNPFWAYSRKKIECELRAMRAYRESGFPVTIVRPSYTYGETWIPAAVGGRDYTVVNRMRRGRKVIVHGDGQSLWTMTHASDFAKGLVGLLGNPKAVGENFHITSDEVLTWDQIYTAIAHAAGVEPKLVHISSEFIAAAVPEWGAFLFGDKACSMVFDNSKIKRFVPEFCATVPFFEGVRRSLTWFDADPSRRTVDQDTDAQIDRIISVYQNR